MRSTISMWWSRRNSAWITFDIGKLQFANATGKDGRLSGMRASMDVESAPFVILHGTKIALDDLVVHAVLGLAGCFFVRFIVFRFASDGRRLFRQHRRLRGFFAVFFRAAHKWTLVVRAQEMNTHTRRLRLQLRRTYDQPQSIHQLASFSTTVFSLLTYLFT